MRRALRVDDSIKRDFACDEGVEMRVSAHAETHETLAQAGIGVERIWTGRGHEYSGPWSLPSSWLCRS